MVLQPEIGHLNRQKAKGALMVYKIMDSRSYDTLARSGLARSVFFCFFSLYAARFSCLA
jgi:hypothetical protein